MNDKPTTKTTQEQGWGIFDCVPGLRKLEPAEQAEFELWKEHIQDVVIPDLLRDREKRWSSSAVVELQKLKLLVEHTIRVADTVEDDDGFIAAYHFKTGAIHRLLSAVRTENYPSYLDDFQPKQDND